MVVKMIYSYLCLLNMNLRKHDETTAADPPRVNRGALRQGSSAYAERKEVRLGSIDDSASLVSIYLVKISASVDYFP